MRLVDDQQEVLGEVVQQTVGRSPRASAVDVAGVVLDPGAGADLPHHLDVVVGAHPQALGLEELVLPFQFRESIRQFPLDPAQRPLHPFRAGHVVARGEDVELRVLGQHLAGHRVQGHEPVDLVAEHLDPNRMLLVHGEDLHGVTPDPERAALEGHVVAGVLHLDQLAQQPIAVPGRPGAQLHHAVHVLLGRAQPVDGRHRRDYQDVPPREQRVRRRVTKAFHLLVDRGVLLDVRIRLRDVRLGLVVVVVRHKVFDGVVRKQFPELVGQLCGQCLVGGQHQGGPLQLLDQPRRRRGLAGARGAEQHDVARTGLHPAGDLGDGGRLVARRLIVGHNLEGCDLALKIGDGTSHVDTLRRGADSHESSASGRPESRHRCRTDCLGPLAEPTTPPPPTLTPEEQQVSSS